MLTRDSTEPAGPGWSHHWRKRCSHDWRKSGPITLAELRLLPSGPMPLAGDIPALRRCVGHIARSADLRGTCGGGLGVAGGDDGDASGGRADRCGGRRRWARWWRRRGSPRVGSPWSYRGGDDPGLLGRSQARGQVEPRQHR